MWPCPERDIVPHNDYIPFPDEAIEGSIPDRFEQQAVMYPDRIAIKSRGRVYTYDDVNRSANRVAHAILNHGGEGPHAVALFLEHGPSPVLAILGILKSGNMYVPIDPCLPPERVSYMFNDSQAKLLITNDRNYSAVRGFVSEDMTIINIDTLDHKLSDENPGLPLKPDTLAAILYTSGSTGQPKGIMSEHYNVLHAVKVGTNHRHISKDDRLALLQSCSVGISRGEIFGALLNGATLLPFDVSPFHPKEEGLNHLARWLVRERITVITMVPTVFRYCIETLTGEETFPSLRLITFGGETVYHRDLELFKQHFSDDCLLRLSMGMSETCSAVTSVYVTKRTEIHGDSMPVGYPHEGIDLLILDEDGRELGSGGTGEIAIRSRCLSPGYWRKPELTAQHFSNCPGKEGFRIYRTGDLGLMSHTGCLYHLGRKDMQVKVRGYRIEPAEVEGALLNIEGISHAAVVVDTDTQGENRLVAYIVFDRRSTSAVPHLRALLKESLPEYMIPSVYLFMDKLPMTISGKVDKKALPAPQPSRQALDSPFAAPHTSVEQRLAAIWSSILKVPSIGIHDDFFDLGGHSLSAVQVFAQIEKRFGKKLPISILFKASTIEKLAAVLSEYDEPENWPTIVPIQTEGSKPPFFCVHDLSGDVVGYAELARKLDPDQPFYGLRAQGLGGKGKPDTQIETMASRYTSEICRIQPEGPYVLGGMCFGGVVAFEIARQLQKQGQTIELLALFDTPCPPFSVPSNILFHLRRYSYHLKENIPGLIRRFSDHSPTHERRNLVDRFFPFRTMIRILRVDRTNQRALRRYSPRSYPGSIVLFSASQPLTKHSHNLQKRWKRYATGGIDVHIVPGDHHTMLREPNVRVLAEKLNEHLTRMQP